MNHEIIEQIKISPRVQKLRDNLFGNKPQIEADRAVIITESYKH